MGISVTKLLIVLAIIVVVFGTKRLANVGGDLGAAIKSFRKAMKEGDNDMENPAKSDHIDSEVVSKKNDKG